MSGPDLGVNNSVFIFLEGLFGTNNVEYADDLRLPDGRIATDLPEFVSAWEVSRERKCQVLDPIDFTPQCRQLPSPRCRVFFKHTNSSLAKYVVKLNLHTFRFFCFVRFSWFHPQIFFVRDPRQ